MSLSVSLCFSKYIVAQIPLENPDTPLRLVLLSSCLAFLIAFLITLVELITGKYSQTIGLFFKESRALYIYGIIYGIFSFLITFFLDSLINSEQIKLEGLGTDNLWIRSFIVGLSIKGLMKISLFNITGGKASEPFPIGPASIIQMFEPSLLIQIGLDEFNAIENFLNPYLKKYASKDISEVRKLILTHLPRIGSPAYRVGLVDDINEIQNVKQLMEIYLIHFGSATFSRVFSRDT